MANKKNKPLKSAKRGTRQEDLVMSEVFDLEKEMEKDFGRRFPVCKEVKYFLRSIEPYADDDQLGKLYDSFLGFSMETQRKMLECALVNVSYGELWQTGVTHIDLLLCDIRDSLFEVTTNIPDSDSEKITKLAQALLNVFDLKHERELEWKSFNEDYQKLLSDTYKK